MGHSDSDPAIHDRRLWNAGLSVGAKRPLKPRYIRAIRSHLDEHKRLRDRALFDLAIDSKLRGCDLVKIRIRDFEFPSRIEYLGPLSTRQYARLVDEWVSTIGLGKREYGRGNDRPG